MTSVKLMLNKDRILKSGQYPLVFQVIRNRKKRLIYMDIRVLEKEFDSRKGKICHFKGGSLNYHKIAIYNQQLEEAKALITHLVNKLEDKDPQYSVDDIVAHYHRKNQTEFLIPYMEEQIKKKEQKNKYGTAAAYRSTMHSVQRFIGSKSVRFIEIDYMFLEDYMQFLSEHTNSTNTITFYMRNFRSIYNRAKKEGMKTITKNPFSEITLKTDKTVKRALTREELKRVMMLELSAQPKLELARDLFLFSFYTRGMPFVDIFNLKKQDVVNDIIFYRRTKTNQPLQVSLIDEIVGLMSKYENDGEYVFPILDPEKPISLYRQYRNALGNINKYLKKVGKMAGIKIPLTTYCARHTWATLAKEAGAPILHISDGLGHASIQTTLAYLKDLDVNTLRELNKRVVAFKV